MKVGDRVRFIRQLGETNPQGWSMPVNAFEVDGTILATVRGPTYKGDYLDHSVMWLPVCFDEGTRAHDYFGVGEVDLFADDFEVAHPSFDIVVSFPSVEDAIAAAELIAPILNQPVQTIRKY